MRASFVLASLAVFGLITMLVGCGNSTGAGIPSVRPPVAAAAPQLFVPASSRTLRFFHPPVPLRDAGGCTDAEGYSEVDGFCLPNFVSRLFPSSAEGPTAIFSLIDTIDGRFKEINDRSAEGTRTCLSNTPTKYDMEIYGNTVSFYFQCYDILTRDGYLLFGKNGDTWYLVDRGGQGGAAVIITPIAGTTDQYTVEAYMGVGYGNATSTDCSSNFDGCSYAAMALKANSQTKAFEFTTAGMGVGFCGVHVKSDGTNMWARSSEEGAGVTCDGAADEVCLLNSDFSAVADGDCSDIDTDDFELATLGRQSTAAANVGGTWAGSTIPVAGGNVLLNGADSDAIHFFPDSATDVSGPTDFNAR